MNTEFEALTSIIHQRRAIYPPFYKDEKIDKSLIASLLKNASMAPNHKRTEPWRFAVLTGKALERLSATMSDYYRDNTPTDQYSEVKHRKSGERPLQCACAIAICISRSPQGVLPAWEETAAVACAVQNLWLSASALGLGGYWSTPPVISSIPVSMGLPDGWECLGLFYLGWVKEGYPANTARKPLEEVSVWLDR